MHIIGPSASDLIPEGVLALKLEATLEDLANTIHAHPTLGEGTMEAALVALGSARPCGPRRLARRAQCRRRVERCAAEPRPLVRDLGRFVYADALAFRTT